MLKSFFSTKKCAVEHKATEKVKNSLNSFLNVDAQLKPKNLEVKRFKKTELNSYPQIRVQIPP